MLDYCIQRASELPFESGRKRLYAVITDKRGRIISEAANSYDCSHPKQARLAKRAGLGDKVFLHAEMCAIIRSRGKGVNLYVARVDSKGNPVLAEPCKICYLGIEEHGSIKSVEFTGG